MNNNALWILAGYAALLVGLAYSGHRTQWKSAGIRRGLLAALVPLGVAAVFMGGLYLQQKSPVVSQESPPLSTAVQAPPKPAHNYEVRDGMDYGYSAAISQDAQKSGQVAPKIIMFKYAGQRDGKHQVHSSDGVNFTAVECFSPCEVMKIMNFINKDYLRDTVHVERIKNQPGTIANLVMEDALNGRLNNYGMGRGKQTFQVWVDERAGYQEHLVKAPPAKQAIPDECLKRYDLSKPTGGELPRPEHCKKLNP